MGCFLLLQLNNIVININTFLNTQIQISHAGSKNICRREESENMLKVRPGQCLIWGPDSILTTPT